MIAYKGFRPGLICRGYQFVMGLNTTEKANCRENGFHCAENPLDCLSYYSSLEHSEYYIVNAGGDIALPAACVIPVLRHYHSIAILKIIFSHTARSYIDVLFYPYHN